MILKVKKDRLSPSEKIHLSSLPAYLGRDPNCHAWIDHPGVSATHARIERGEDGLIAIVDLSSTNGIWHQGARTSRILLHRKTQFQLGPVACEVIEIDDELEKTQTIEIPIMGGKRLASVLSPLRASATHVFIIFLLSLAVGSLFLGETGSVIADCMGALLVYFPLCAFVAGIVALLAKVHGQHYRYRAALKATLLIFSAVVVFGVLSHLFLFNLPGRKLAQWLGLFITVVGVGIVLVSLTSIIFAEKPLLGIVKWVGGIEVAFVLLLLFLSTSKGLKGTSFSGTVSYPINLFARPSMPALLDDFDRTVSSIDRVRAKTLLKLRK